MNQSRKSQSQRSLQSKKLPDPWSIGSVLLCLLTFSSASQFCTASGKQNQGSERLSVLMTEAGSQFSNAASGPFELSAGTALLAPRENVDVQINNCSITSAAGAALLLSLNTATKVGCVTNLCESGGRSVQVKFGDCSLKLSAGHQAWFGPSESLVAAAIKEEPGRPTLVRQHQNTSGVIAEFFISPATLLDTTPIIQSMKESTRPQERKLYNRIVKTSAALTMAH